jgi:hypothetical protein
MNPFGITSRGYKGIMKRGSSHAKPPMGANLNSGASPNNVMSRPIHQAGLSVMGN